MLRPCDHGSAGGGMIDRPCSPHAQTVPRPIAIPRQAGNVSLPDAVGFLTIGQNPIQGILSAVLGEAFDSDLKPDASSRRHGGL